MPFSVRIGWPSAECIEAEGKRVTGLAYISRDFSLFRNRRNLLPIRRKKAKRATFGAIRFPPDYSVPRLRANRTHSAFLRFNFSIAPRLLLPSELSGSCHIPETLPFFSLAMSSARTGHTKRINIEPGKQRTNDEQRQSSSKRKTSKRSMNSFILSTHGSNSFSKFDFPNIFFSVTRKTLLIHRHFDPFAGNLYTLIFGWLQC